MTPLREVEDGVDVNARVDELNALARKVARDERAWRTREMIIDGEVVVAREWEYAGIWAVYHLTEDLILYVTGHVTLRPETVELRQLQPDEVKGYEYQDDDAVDDDEKGDDARAVKGWRQPKGVLPCVVPIGLVLNASELAAVYLSHIEAYSVGFMIHFMVVRQGEPKGPWLDNPRASSDKDGSGLRFGVGFSDGRVLDEVSARNRDSGMRVSGGGGSYERWSERFWVWPIPPPGQMVFLCEWEQLGMEETKSVFDANKVRDAATRAIAVFGDNG